MNYGLLSSVLLNQVTIIVVVDNLGVFRLEMGAACVVLSLLSEQEWGGYGVFPAPVELLGDVMRYALFRE